MTRSAEPYARTARDVKGDPPSPDETWSSLIPDSTGGYGLVRGPAPDLSTANDLLRRARLRAAVLFLIVTVVVLSVWRGVAVGADLIFAQAAVLCGLGATLATLWSRVRLSARALRVLEFAAFGAVAAYLSARQYKLMHVWVTNADEVSVLSAVKSTMIGTILLTFAYGMLIPNTWRQAAVVVAAIVGLPVATEAILMLTHREAFWIAWKFMTWRRVTEDAVNMGIAAGLSVYGSHVINSLRNEAFEARQLNQYRLGRRLGEGGMGEVYLAEHRLLKRPCALKLIRPATAADPVSLNRFEREVQATARLSHPNTVEIYDYGRTEVGTFFYVMEYLPGLSLDGLVKRHGPMPSGRVIYLLRQVCEALAEAHAAGLIHRDIKPANIFACLRGGRYDVAKLLDFGLVKATGPDDPGQAVPEVSREGMVRGTPLYMAPEQITASRVLDHRCDLYALGGVAYTLLTGQPPFQGADSSRVMTAQVRDRVAPPRQSRPDIPEDLQRVVLRCLAKSPCARFPDAESLASALAACQAAADWDAAKAARWWRECEPAATSQMPA